MSVYAYGQTTALGVMGLLKAANVDDLLSAGRNAYTHAVGGTPVQVNEELRDALQKAYTAATKPPAAPAATSATAAVPAVAGTLAEETDSATPYLLAGGLGLGGLGAATYLANRPEDAPSLPGPGPDYE